MGDKSLAMIAAAFVLSAAAAPQLASAESTDAKLQKDAEIKNPVGADAAIAKDEDKDAKKQAHRAHKDAKVAAHKARVAARTAGEAAPPASSSP